MARSRSRAKKAPKKSRSVRSTSHREEPAEVEVVEEGRGATWEAGVAVATFLALLVALILLDKFRGGSYGDGVLF